MFNFLPTAKEPNLAKAGNLLVIEFAVGITLAFALGQLGLPNDAAFIGILLFNLLPASYLGKAARAQGKNAIWYGLISALPPGALFSYSNLRNHELFAD